MEVCFFTQAYSIWIDWKWILNDIVIPCDKLPVFPTLIVDEVIYFFDRLFAFFEAVNLGVLFLKPFYTMIGYK